MSFNNRDLDDIEKIRESKKDKSDLKTVLNRKTFDSFELDMLMNEAD
jgi:hypothetical protein